MSEVAPGGAIERELATRAFEKWKSGFLKEWNSPGRTIDAFLGSLRLSDEALADVRRRTQKKVRVLQGPIGSGKTTGIMGACVANAMRQPKGHDGIRRYSLLVLRTDYRLLWSTFITPFWQKWFPADAPWTEWSGGKNQPADQTIRLNTPTGKVVMTVAFRAIGEDLSAEDISNFFRGQLPNDIWLEEADAFPLDVYQLAFGRIGRGTPMNIGGPTCPTLFLGTNAPLVGSWMHERIIKSKWTPGVQYFNQPGGRSPDAENLHNLPPTYYIDQVEELDEWMVARLVDNEFVLPRSGMPIYGEFKDARHTSLQIIMPDPMLQLVFGMDCGLDPALASTQRDGDGQWRCINEIASEHGTGSQRFAELVNAMLALPRYEPWNGRRHLIRCVVDPNAQWGVDKKIGEKNWLMRVAELTGLTIVPARSNKTSDRKDTMRAALKRMVGAARPGFVVSYECPMIRAGLGGLYHYGEINLVGAGSGKGLTGEPVKTKESHPVEACEYALMELGGLEDAVGMLGRLKKKQPRHRFAEGGNDADADRVDRDTDFDDESSHDRQSQDEYAES